MIGPHWFITQNDSLLLYINPLVLEQVKEDDERELKGENYSPKMYTSGCLLMVSLQSSVYADDSQQRYCSSSYPVH